MSLSRSNRFAPIAIFVLALVSRLAYWLYRGTALGKDTNGYVGVCSTWFADPLAALFARKGILYTGFTLPLCSVLSLPGATFDLWIAIQIVISAVGCVLVYRIGAELVDYRAGIFSGVALAVLWDTFLWDVYVLSDSLFTFGMILVLWALTWHHREQTWRSKVAVLATMGYLLISRPHGFPLVAGWIIYDIFPRDDNRRLDLLPTRWISALIPIIAIALAPYAIQRYRLLDMWQSGWIIYDGSTYVYPYVTAVSGGTIDFILSNIHHLLAMAVLKLLFFFTPFLPRHSLIHIGINLVTYLPIVLLGFIGLRRAWREDFHLFRMWATPIVVLAAVTAVTFVSWDLRYRVPLGPAFALLFGYSISRTLDSLSDGENEWLNSGWLSS